jgi:hypothetical protein
MSNKHHETANRLVQAIESDFGQDIGSYGKMWLQVILAKELEKIEKEQIPQKDPNRSYEL